MKKSTKTVQISIMSMAVALTLGTGAVCLRPTSANASNAYLQTAITYQGEDNWYNYSGDLSTGTLYNMFYCQTFAGWQGDKSLARIYNDRMLQTPTTGSDVMRAYVFSHDGKLTIEGTIDAFTDTNTSVDVSIVLCKRASLDNQQTLLGETTIEIDSPSLSLADNSALQNIEIDVGDTLFLIASQSEGVDVNTVSGAIFKVDFVLEDITEYGVPQNVVPSSTIEVGTGDYVCTYDGNAMRTPDVLLVNAMNVDNQTGNYYYCYQSAGLKKISNMTYYPTKGGFPYEMKNSMDSVRSVWYNRFYSNYDNGFGYAGVKYVVPQDGTVSVFGAYIQSNLDGADKNSDALYTGYRLIRIRNGSWTTILDKEITPEMGYFADDEETQNISVEKGDELVVLYIATDAWNVSVLSVVFDYQASPVALRKGWLATADVTDEQFASSYSDTQGENGWYYLYGDIENGYAKLYYDATESVYKSADGSYASLGQKSVNVSNAVTAMKAYRATANGNARLALRLESDTLETQGVTLSVYKRIYSADGYGDAENLYTTTVRPNKNFAEYSVNDVALNKGDMIFFCVKGNGEMLNKNTSVVNMDVYANLEKTSDGDNIGDDIGDTVVKDETASYSDEQGKNYWYYAYGDVEKYILMKYGFGDVSYERWNGVEWNNYIETFAMGVGPYLCTMKMYVCPANGTVSLQGSVELLSTDGDNGVSTFIYLNNQRIWFQELAADSTEVVNIEGLTEISVKKGDILKFYVKNNETATVAYNSSVDFKVSVGFVAADDEVLTEEQARAYVKDVSYRDYYGIKDESNIEKTEETTGFGCGSVSHGVWFSVLALLPLAYVAIRRKEV